MELSDVAPLRVIRQFYQAYFVWRFGKWEILHDGLTSHLFFEHNDHCPARGIPVPPSIKSTETMQESAEKIAKGYRHGT